MPEFQVDLRRVIFLLARAVDLVGVDDVYHGRRVGMIAFQVARRLGWEAPECHWIYDAGLIHDCGVSTTREHHSLIVEIEWAGAPTHCRIGAQRLERYPPLAPFASLVRWHHTPWTELITLTGDARLARQANLIHLSDRVDAISASPDHRPPPGPRDESLRQLIQARSGTAFASELVEAFLEVSSHPEFWEDLRSPTAIEAFQAGLACSNVGPTLDWASFRQAAALIQEIVDAKSPFTHEHSLGVARVARLLAERVGLSARHCERVETAGLLHDLGKLRVPDEILEAPRPLTTAEYATMKGHCHETFELMREVEGLDDVTFWAACHHEQLNGHGYPWGLTAKDLPLEARIVAVADIYQALAQHRPYRSSLPSEAILADLQERASGGSIDASLVAEVASDPLAFHLAAVGSEAPHPSSKAPEFSR